MDQNSLSKIAPPVQQTSPEEDAKLLAIEALEAQSVDLDTPTQPPAPMPEPQPIVTAPIPEPVEPTAPVAPPQPAPPQTPAARMAEAIANEPAPKRFQFFLHQKPPRKQFVIGGLALVIIGLCIGAYFTLS
jgi:hypothetical protein